jgi:hypothetical protein
VTLICVGGRRHGELIEVEASAREWVDLLSAERYYPGRFPYVEKDPTAPRSLLRARGRVVMALVHEDIAEDRQSAQQAFHALALSKLYDALGAQDVPVDTIIPKNGPQSPNGRTGHQA